MDLEKLKEEMSYKWRVQSVNEYNASCVAYVDARDVQNKLDEVCGPDNWQCKFSEHKNNLFCSIGILCDSKATKDSFTGAKWCWKEDCGIESMVEKQKGEASDSFKRAAVMWGVGRFLYNKPIIKLDSIKNKRGKWVASFNGKILYNDKITAACEHQLKNK